MRHSGSHWKSYEFKWLVSLLISAEDFFLEELLAVIEKNLKNIDDGKD